MFVLQLQEELSTRICGLLKVFSDGTSALSFAAAFFATQANEWSRLDQWRMDKYMMVTVNKYLCAAIDHVQFDDECSLSLLSLESFCRLGWILYCLLAVRDYYIFVWFVC